MSNYNVIKIDEKTYLIQDQYKDSMYLLVGTTKALCIDCGMDEEPIMPIIRTITDLPVELIATHAHFDHCGRSSEFEHVYIHPKDAYLYEQSIKYFQHLSFKPYQEIEWIDFDEYDLDGRIIEIIPLFGHTQGSIILVDSMYQHVYTGDAIGSGCGVWMQVDQALGLDDYMRQLQNAQNQLIALGVDESWHFLGGHNEQEYQSKVGSYNRLDIDLLDDMIMLNLGLLKGEIKLENTDMKEFYEKPYYASYQKAEMIFTQSQIECQKIDLNHAIDAMNNYLSQFDLDDPKIKLKMIHTYEVMNAANYITTRENMDQIQSRLACLIALLHDIGRFEQIKQYHHFEDTSVDHAVLGVQILFEQGLIRNFIECDDYDEIIKNVIANHSLYKIEDGLDPISYKQASIIRDSDKLDNYRVKYEEDITTLFDISVDEFVKEKVSEKMIEDVRNHQLIKKEDRNNHIDRWISYLAFLFDLHYKSSYQFIKDHDYINKTINRFNYEDQVSMNTIQQLLNEYLEENL